MAAVITVGVAGVIIAVVSRRLSKTQKRTDGDDSTTSTSAVIWMCPRTNCRLFENLRVIQPTTRWP